MKILNYEEFDDYLHENEDCVFLVYDKHNNEFVECDTSSCVDYSEVLNASDSKEKLYLIILECKERIKKYIIFHYSENDALESVISHNGGSLNHQKADVKEIKNF